MKRRAPFTCQLSYSGYSYLLSGILPGKNRKFFIQFANYICHVQATQSIGEHSEACGRNSWVEDGQLCSAVPEALLPLIIHEEARCETAEDGPRLFFRLLSWPYARCHEPPSLPSPGSVWKKWENKAWRTLHLIEWIFFAIKNAQGDSLVVQWLRVCLPMQGTRARALVWEDPTCRGATRPVSHNYWACASGACAPQQERPR